jgi:hypothetical protein
VIVLILYIAYVVTKTINQNKLIFWSFFLMILAMMALFFFNTAVGTLLAILVPAAFMMNRYRNDRGVAICIAILILSIFGSSMYAIGEHQAILDKIHRDEYHWAEKRTRELINPGGKVGGYSVKDLAILPVYAVMSVIAPFPGMVDVPTRYGTPHDDNWYYMPGNMIWNIVAFFSVIGFYYSIRNKFSESFMVWAFTGGYLYILMYTILFTRVRFAYLSMPLMLALVSVGLVKTKKRGFWIIYLIGAGIATIIWNKLRLGIHH